MLPVSYGGGSITEKQDGRRRGAPERSARAVAARLRHGPLRGARRDGGRRRGGGGGGGDRAAARDAVAGVVRARHRGVGGRAGDPAAAVGPARAVAARRRAGLVRRRWVARAVARS